MEAQVARVTERLLPQRQRLVLVLELDPEEASHPPRGQSWAVWWVVSQA